MVKEKTKYKERSILFHPIHGALRVEKIFANPRSDAGNLCYHLKPAGHNYAGTSFFIPADRICEEGLHRPLTAVEAQKILKRLKKSKRNKVMSQERREIELVALRHQNTPAAFADILSMLARTGKGKYAWGKRIILQYSAAALVHEIAFALKISAAEASLLIRKALAHSIRVNRWVLKALGRLDENEKE